MKKNFLKKAISLIMSAAMIFTLPGLDLALTASTEEAEETDEVIQIGTAAELADFRDRVKNGAKTLDAVLTADIDLSDVCGANINGEEVSWTPIMYYSGKFDGGRHTISGLYINDENADYQGLFGTIDAPAEIKNLNVNGDIIAKSECGGICGFNIGGTITNCNNFCNVSGDYEVGGICGLGSEGKITNCSNTGAVYGGINDVGGICGSNYYSEITSCLNMGTISGDNYHVGGICGEIYFGTITDCSNMGTISGDVSQVGGICGEINFGTITDCSNTGNIHGDNFAGGICGSNAKAAITNCSNTGNIQGDSFVGGICGYNTFCEEDDVGGIIKSCSNTGNIQGDSFVGGICGYDYIGEITDCSNTGSISDSSNVGGICGYNHNGTITSCYYLSDCSAGGINGEEIEGSAEPRSDEEFKSGNVCVQLGHAYIYDICCLCGDIKTPEQDDNGVYQIRYCANLVWFRDKVNSGETDLNAALTADIDLSGVCGKDIGNWNPIGNKDNQYSGEFDGGGHTIKNFYIDNEKRRLSRLVRLDKFCHN